MSQKCGLWVIVLSEKLKYLDNGTLFFETACVEIQQTLSPITYVKTSQIDDQRLIGIGQA